MASKKTTTSNNRAREDSDELLDELASFLYDTYQHSKEKDSDKIELEKGQIAENEDKT